MTNPQCFGDEQVLISRSELAYLLSVDEALAMFHVMGVRDWEGYKETLERISNLRNRNDYKDLTLRYPKRA